MAVLLYRRLARGGPTPTAPSPSPAPASPLRRFSYAQIRRATASFAPSHRLGQGGFGLVFRGALPSGEEIAVKIMDSCGSVQGDREFHNELALASKILSVPSSAAVVLPALGYCFDDGERRRRRWRWCRRREAEEPLEASEATAASPGRKLLLVYELMHNGSLQDALLDRRCPELMDWGRRFAVVIDVARSLHFLHAVCDPPVIHGDIKPSNILLDARLSAKIADFGLARLRNTGLEDHLPAQEEVTVDIDLQKCALNGSKTLGKERTQDSLVGGGEDDASVMAMEETAESMTTTGFEEQEMNGGVNGTAATERLAKEDEGFIVASPATAVEVASVSEAGADFDGASIGSWKDATASGLGKGRYKKKTGASSGKDPWWRQDIKGGGPNSVSGGSSKDYVMEWIQSEIKRERPKSNWIIPSTATATEECQRKPSDGGRSERKKTHRRMKWWASLNEERLKKKEKSRSPREWWREEYCEELMNKQKLQAATKSKSISDGCGEQHWWQSDEDFASPSEKRRKKKKKKKKSYGCGCRRHNSMGQWMDRISGEIRTTRRSNLDWPSVDIPKSGAVSSTLSMRGTVCYVAPECGGSRPLLEKCDVYSFGVLLLVIISGRRPLQVTASPMLEFERANLISWTRHLAHLGKLQDLVDPCLRHVDKEQALLCITVALLCLQRSPSSRPSSKEILSMLTGESEPPNLPLEFSPSPPDRFSFKLPKKAR